MPDAWCSRGCVVPLLDFGNHTLDPRACVSWATDPASGDVVVHAPLDRGLEPGDEVRGRVREQFSRHTPFISLSLSF